MPVSTVIVAGALTGISVRVWRYRIRGLVLAKNLAAAAIGTTALLWVAPEDISLWALFCASYFTSQSMGYGQHIKSIGKKFKPPEQSQQ